MTGQSAQRLGLQDRGVIQAGNYADLVIFDQQSITDHATFLEPHQYSTGVEHLLINGQLAIQDGQLTTALPGQTLKHQQKH